MSFYLFYTTLRNKIGRTFLLQDLTDIPLPPGRHGLHVLAIHLAEDVVYDIHGIEGRNLSTPTGTQALRSWN